MVAILWSHNLVEFEEFERLVSGGVFCNRNTYKQDGYLLIYKDKQFIRVYD